MAAKRTLKMSAMGKVLKEKSWNFLCFVNHVIFFRAGYI